MDGFCLEIGIRYDIDLEIEIRASAYMRFISFRILLSTVLLEWLKITKSSLDAGEACQAVSR
jgi:hypothetical protein